MNFLNTKYQLLQNRFILSGVTMDGRTEGLCEGNRCSPISWNDPETCDY